MALLAGSVPVECSEANSEVLRGTEALLQLQGAGLQHCLSSPREEVLELLGDGGGVKDLGVGGGEAPAILHNLQRSC